jgi:hypothetical protein
MTTNHKRLRPSSLHAGLVPSRSTSPGATAEAIPFNGLDWALDWTYSETAEGLDGEVASPVGSFDMDGEAGLIYDGVPGGSINVRAAVDVSAGNLTPEATDSVILAIFKNNDPIGQADEGFVAELDTGTAEFNVSAYTTLKTGDVLRVALVGATANETDVDYALSEDGQVSFT